MLRCVEAAILVFEKFGKEWPSIPIAGQKPHHGLQLASDVVHIHFLPFCPRAIAPPFLDTPVAEGAPHCELFVSLAEINENGFDSTQPENAHFAAPALESDLSLDIASPRLPAVSVDSGLTPTGAREKKAHDPIQMQGGRE